jgi:diguanylate cyclase (GGDEF)-like protein
MPTAVALQAVMDIVDGVTIGYEVLSRPAAGRNPLRTIEAGVAAAHVTAPAVVFVPVPRRVLATSGAELTNHVGELRIAPGRLAWLISDSGRAGLRAAEEQTLRQLRDAGGRLAVDLPTPPSLTHGLVASLHPDFVFLDLRTGWLRHGDLADAQLAATIAFVARMNGILLARGLDTSAAAAAALNVGIQYGVGRHLESPVVLEPDLARAGDTVVGSSWFQSRETRVITEREMSLKEPFVLEPARVAPGSDVTEATFARLLSETSDMLQAEHDAEAVLRAAAGAFLQTIPADRLVVFEADHHLNRMRPRILAGAGAEGFTGQDIPLSSGITGWAFARGVPYRCGDTEAHPASAALPRSDRLRESLLAIPLVASDQRMGIIDLWRQGLDSFSDEDLERAALLGLMTSAAWRSARQFADIEQRALTDALTGLYNRRWWRDMAPRLAAQSRRNQTPVGILLMDLDHFKQVNDSAGHAAGDAVLRAVAGALQASIREGDYAVRYGGEEFLAILPGTDSPGAVRAAEAVHTAIRGAAAGSGVAVPVTASVGVGAFPEHGASLDAVVQAADQAMYRAKREGGDRVLIA